MLFHTCRRWGYALGKFCVLIPWDGIGKWLYVVILLNSRLRLLFDKSGLIRPLIGKPVQLCKRRYVQNCQQSRDKKAIHYLLNWIEQCIYFNTVFNSVQITPKQTEFVVGPDGMSIKNRRKFFNHYLYYLLLLLYGTCTRMLKIFQLSIEFAVSSRVFIFSIVKVFYPLSMEG